MATVPTRTIAAASVKQAVGSNGSTAQNTLTVFNTLVGQNQLLFTLTVAETATTDAIFLKDAMDTNRTTVDARTTFSAPKFANYTAFMQYLTYIPVYVDSMEISTDDVDNFKGNLIFKQTFPTGEVKEVSVPLRRYRQNVGNGYGETIRINDFPFAITPSTSVRLSSIKANTSIDMTFSISMWGNTKEMSALESQVIGG